MKTIHVVEDTLPQAWETAVVRCWSEGASFMTQYDKAGDPPSKDVMAMIHVRRPFEEPRIHRAFPGGLADLEKYRSEVLYGVHDYWMDDLTNANRWEYTYHQRLFAYVVPCPRCAGDGFKPDCPQCHGQRSVTIDQIDKCIEMLKTAGHTRRAQAITWQAWEDLGIGDPACLQRLWFRIEDGLLNMTADMRSNDAYKAAFMNFYAFTELQKSVAAAVGVEPGEYVHTANSFHIYGSYFNEFKGFLNLIGQRAYADRVYESSFAASFFIEACEELLTEDKMPALCRQKVKERLDQLQATAG